MADAAATAWTRIAKQLAGDLPGTWRLARSGIKTILVREPIDWVVVWAGVNRIRRDDDPWLIGGDAPLVGPFHLSVGHGLRSDQHDGPSQINLHDDSAAQQAAHFITDVLLPRLDKWSADQYSNEAEAQLAEQPAEREPPMVFPQAAGWRVVLDKKSPEGPCRQAVRWLANNFAADDANWYQSLLRAWKSGGHQPALEYLQQQRADSIASLKLK